MSDQPQSPAPPPSTALARVSADESFRLAFEPANFQQAMEVAAMISKIRFCGIEHPEEAMIRIMTGRALGLPTFAALRTIFTIDGKPAMEARGKVGLVLNNPLCELWERVESTHETCTYRTKRRGAPKVEEFTFTIEMARRAQLVDRGDDERGKKMNNWNRYPEDMLRARCTGRLVDIVYPDITLGIASREELEDERELRGEVVPPGQGGAAIPTPMSTPQAAQTPAPKQAAVARDFPAEADALKVEIAETKGDEELKKLRGKIGSFAAAAGDALGNDVKRFFTLHHPPKPAPAPEMPSKPAVTAAETIAAANARKSGQTPAPAPVQQSAHGATAPRGEWLPPHKRGDSYEGPEGSTPPVPFG